MNLSLPCPKCDQKQDFASITPTGIMQNRAVSWTCPCGARRLVEISHRIPQDLVRRAVLADIIARRGERE